MEKRWAQLTLSAFYDNPEHYAGITRDDPESLLVEQLVQAEAGRRRTVETALVRASAVGCLGIAAKDRNEELLSILGHIQKVQYPWREQQQPEDKKSELDNYVEYYHRVMAAWEVQKARLRKKKDGSN